MWVLSVIVSVIVFEVLLKKLSRKMEMLWLRFSLKLHWHVTRNASRTFLFCYLGARGSHTVGINQPLNYAVEYFSLISFCFVGREGGGGGGRERHSLLIIRRLYECFRTLSEFWENFRKRSKISEDCRGRSVGYHLLPLAIWAICLTRGEKFMHHV